MASEAPQTGETPPWTLTTPRTANVVALVVFLVVFAASLVGIVAYAATGPSSQERPAVTTTDKTTTVVGPGTDGSPPPTTVTTEKATESSTAEPGLLDRLVTPPVWLILELAVALLAAFVAGAVAQRVLLGRYGFSLGPLSIPEISGSSVADKGEQAIREIQEITVALSSAAFAGVSPEGVEAASLPTSTGDPNLALVALRIELERRLSRLAASADIAPPPRNTLRRMIDLLTRAEVLTYPLAESLLGLVQLGNQAAHGGTVAPEAGEWAQREGPRLLAALDALADARGAPKG
jgi:hypothetical protein